LELRKSKNTPWVNTILIDEHAFKKDPKTGRKQFVTSFVDNARKCLREIAPSRYHGEMWQSISHIPGRENVTHAVIDMTGTYKNFIEDYFQMQK
jgi:transposase